MRKSLPGDVVNNCLRGDDGWGPVETQGGDNLRHRGGVTSEATADGAKWQLRLERTES